MTPDEAARCYDEVAAALCGSPLLQAVVRGREAGPAVMSAAGWLTFGRAVGELFRLWDLMRARDKAARPMLDGQAWHEVLDDAAALAARGRLPAASLAAILGRAPRGEG